MSPEQAFENAAGGSPGDMQLVFIGIVTMLILAWTWFTAKGIYEVYQEGQADFQTIAFHLVNVVLIFIVSIWLVIALQS